MGNEETQVPAGEQTSVAIIPIEKVIEQEIVKNNLTETVLVELKERYGNLRLRSVDDHEFYLDIKSAAKDCAKLRNRTVTVCKKNREEAIKIQKAWVKEEGRIVARISEVEDPLDAEIKKYDDELNRKAELERKRLEEQYMKRSQELSRMGALYSDGKFTLGEVNLDADTIKVADAALWENTILPSYKAEFEKAEADRAAEEKRKEEARIKLEQEQAEFRRQQEEFAAQQKAFREQQETAEKKRLEDERIKEDERRQAEQKERDRLAEEKRLKDAAEAKLWRSRMAQFDNTIGWNGQYAFERGNDEVPVITYEQFVTLDDDAFKSLLDSYLQSYNEKQRIAEEKRLADIEEQKRIAAEAAAKAERERIEEANKQAEIKKQQDIARQAEELAKAGDKANWDAYIHNLKAIPKPVLKSGQYRKIGAIATEKIEEIYSLKP